MSRLKTASQANFAQTVHADVRRSAFLRPSTHKTTFNCGDIVPVYVDEVIPGDTFHMNMKFLSRLSTPIFPTMDDIKIEFMAFYVPNRLVWDGWEELHGENKTGAWTPAEDPALVPVFENGIQLSKRIGDYMGFVPGCDFSKNKVSALPFRALALTYNEWFRDQNLQAPIPLNKGNSVTSVDEVYGPNGTLLKANKFHDYFTSALPQPQKGDSPLIPLELNELIPVVTGDDIPTEKLGSANLRMFVEGVNNNYTPGRARALYTVDGPIGTGTGALNNSKKSEVRVDYTPTSNTAVGSSSSARPLNLYADGRNMRITGSTISELRTAFQIQKLFEKDARGGTRYIEMLKAHFGVEAGDYRLQRPEFLGRYSSTVGIQSVPQTSSTDSTSPQGNLAAYSLTTGGSNLFSKSFVEHGYVIIVAVARQVKTYQQGIEKFWSRRDRFDFYYPSLAHISEQPILNREIYCLGENDQDEVFGYQEAWADYRYKPNRVSGQMRSGVTNSLDIWHYADVYDNTPLLSDGWITDNSATNVDRTLAVNMSQDDQIRIDMLFDCLTIRPMPVNSIPGLVDHF